MRVAVLADIHGNLPALEAVLAEPDVRAADRLVLLGDIALGPLPAESLDVLDGLGARAVWVHGNCEREVVAAYDAGLHPGPGADGARDTAGLLGPRHRDLLDGLPLTVTLDCDDLGRALFCHATPRRDDEFVLVDSPLPVWERALAGVEEELVVMGHTHMPFDRLVAGRRVVNPGSVGMSYGAPGACWALLGASVELRRTAYDVEAAATRIRAGAHPRAAAWADEYVVSPPGDAEALEVFTKLVDPLPEQEQGESRPV
jgi:predicted phosphodiesterase